MANIIPFLVSLPTPSSSIAQALRKKCSTSALVSSTSAMLNKPVASYPGSFERIKTGWFAASSTRHIKGYSSPVELILAPKTSTVPALITRTAPIPCRTPNGSPANIAALPIPTTASICSRIPSLPGSTLREPQ